MTEPGGRVLIWGAGAIGGSIGAHLGRAGFDVTLVDTSAPHIEAIRNKGLSIVGPVEQFDIDVPAALPEQLEGQWRIVMLAVKAQHTDAACRALAPHLAPGGGVLSLQNGLQGEVIARHFGREGTHVALGSVVGDVLGPGEIRFGGCHEMAIGQIDGQGGPLLAEIVAIMQAFDPRAFGTPEVQNYLWGKHCFNTITCASAMALSPLAELVARDDLKGLWGDLCREVLAVARAEGITPYKFGPFDPKVFAPGSPPEAGEAFLRVLAAGSGKDKKPHSGMWRDLAVHKRQTEVDALLTPIAERGERHGLKSPLLRAVVSMVVEIEQGKRRQDDANLLELIARGA